MLTAAACRTCAANVSRMSVAIDLDVDRGTGWALLAGSLKRIRR
jgi:hypothetical protein